MSDGLLIRRSAGFSALCSTPMSKRGRPSIVGGPNGAECARLCSTHEAISALRAASWAGVTASSTMR